MIPYVDIHTHLGQNKPGVVAIRNIIAGHDAIPLNQFFSYGIYPWYGLDGVGVHWQNILTNPYCLAIGECGLDFQKEILTKVPLPQQEDVFIKQISLSNAYQKPLIIHCVKCFDQLIKIRQQYNTISQAWIVHGFNKNKDIASKLIKAGFYLSFGSLIFKSHKLQLALKGMPMEKLFLETDAQQNFSIEEIYKQAAKILNISEKILKMKLYENFLKVFQPPAN